MNNDIKTIIIEEPEPELEPEPKNWDNAETFLNNLLKQIDENPPQHPQEYDLFMTHLLEKPQTVARDIIEGRAKRKLYHDFESTYACPKMRLAEDLDCAGYRDMVGNTHRGDYDF